MVDREPWSVGKLDHGQTPRLHHSQPWSTMVGNEKPWYHGQTVAGVRLQLVIGTHTPFGGISLITVGDLFQLKPVFVKWIFENSQTGYNEFPTNI